MRYTLNIAGRRIEVAAKVGRVNFCGADLLPHEAEMLAEAIRDCAATAERKADREAAALQPQLIEG